MAPLCTDVLSNYKERKFNTKDVNTVFENKIFGVTMSWSGRVVIGDRRPGYFTLLLSQI